MVSSVGWLLRAMLFASIAAPLAACQSAGDSGFTSLANGLSGRIEAPGVPILIESIEGAPESLKRELAGALASEASVRRVELVSAAGAARYRLRGYITAYRSDDGRTTLAFVWDVFDRAKRRSRRVEGSTVAGRGVGSDPWGAVDRAEIHEVASQSMNEIAAFLAESSGAGT